jgi:hypothetical protein
VSLFDATAGSGPDRSRARADTACTFLLPTRPLDSTIERARSPNSPTLLLITLMPSSAWSRLRCRHFLSTLAGKVENEYSTLIWRVDMTSASQLGELRGVERLGSGAAMMRAIHSDVKAFLRDTPRGR